WRRRCCLLSWGSGADRRQESFRIRGTQQDHKIEPRWDVDRLRWIRNIQQRFLAIAKPEPTGSIAGQSRPHRSTGRLKLAARSDIDAAGRPSTEIGGGNGSAIDVARQPQ